MNKLLAGLFVLALLPRLAMAQDAPMPPLRPDQVAFRALYKELVETNTALSVGSCTARLTADGGTPQDRRLSR